MNTEIDDMRETFFESLRRIGRSKHSTVKALARLGIGKFGEGQDWWWKLGPIHVESAGTIEGDIFVHAREAYVPDWLGERLWSFLRQTPLKQQLPWKEWSGDDGNWGMDLGPVHFYEDPFSCSWTINLGLIKLKWFSC